MAGMIIKCMCTINVYVIREIHDFLTTNLLKFQNQREMHNFQIYDIGLNQCDDLG